MKYLPIDGNAIGYACQFTPVLMSEGMEVQALYGIIRTIAKRIAEWPEHYPIVLWDGHPQWRYDLYPPYKSGRQKESSVAARAAYRKQVPFMRKMIETLGVTQITSAGAEADDLGHQLGAELATQGHDVVLLTCDTDWLQNISPRISWFDPKFARFAGTPAEMAAVVGTGDRIAYLQAKAMVGDSSDSIEGVAKIGAKTAPKILKEFGSVQRFFELVDQGQYTPKTVALKNLASEEGRATFSRNMRLIDLTQAPKLRESDLDVVRSALEPEQFEGWCERFGFKQFLRDIDATLRPFASLRQRQGRPELDRAIAWLNEEEDESLPV